MIARLMGLPTIDPATLERRRRAGSVAIFDVNALASWRAGHVPGARHLDHAAFTAAELPAAREQPVVFYCSNPLCRKAPLAAKRALRMGWTNVAVLSAGISGWTAAGLPVEAGA